MKVKQIVILCAMLIIIFSHCGQKSDSDINWNHYSNKNGDFFPPNGGNQQTASLVLDIDNDGVNDFVIAERTQSPAVVWYRRAGDSWERFVVDHGALHVAPGSDCYDIDRDGDLDIALAGDSNSNEIWWWENPYPDYEPETAWVRHYIKNSGETKQHDLIFGDFDCDSTAELVFWNQNAYRLFYAEIPEDPHAVETWTYTAIFSYDREETVPSHGSDPFLDGKNEHQGLAKADIDGDGKMDIIGGGYWFKHERDAKFNPMAINESPHFSHVAAGQLIDGGRPEIVMVAGNGLSPLIMYEWQQDQWIAHTLLDSVVDGHSLDIIDFNNDGYLDIFCAEMRLTNESPKTRILLNDGSGNFKTLEFFEGFGQHESRIADLDGDGDYDILGKPYTWMAPRLDVWLQK